MMAEMMTPADLAAIRERQIEALDWAPASCCDDHVNLLLKNGRIVLAEQMRRSDAEPLIIASRAVPALLAHIDVLAAEVERLKGEVDSREDTIRETQEYLARLGYPADLQGHPKEGISKMEDAIAALRALVREAVEIVARARDQHYDAQLAPVDRCPWCKAAELFIAKASENAAPKP